jgi:hypothetical protein
MNWKPRFLHLTGQAPSLIGSVLTNFALVWWITQTTGSTSVGGGGIAAPPPAAIFSARGRWPTGSAGAPPRS